MATSSLYGTSSESTGLYGIGAASGGTYFEWFIFQDSATAPATPTGGSWSFTTNTGTAPSGWLNAPPASPVNQVWVSIAVVDSRSTSTLTWSTPGLMTGSGLPVLTGAGVPSSGTGLNGQLYINTSTTPQSLYNKQSGAWVQLTGSTLYATAGANTNITSLTGITGGISSPTYLQLSTSGGGSSAVGKFQWDSTFGGPAVGMAGGNTTLNIGQDEFVYVYNNTGSTITKGQVVYVSGSQGQRLTVGLAQANADATSISVLGFANESIANNSSGFVASVGLVSGINTNGFADGVSIWLSPTVPGGFTVTKPVAPNHLVLLGYVVKGGSTGGGSIFVFTQNGYELDELHDVRITSVANKNLLQYDSSVPAWVNIAGPSGAIVGTTDTQTLTNKSISGSANTLTNIPNSALVYDSVNVNGVDLTLGAVQLLGADWILPSYAGNAGKVLAINPSASNVQWIAAGGVGTVTSVDVSGGTTGLTTFNGPITAAGTITLGGTLSIANGGTGQTSATAAFNALAPSQTGNSGKYLTTDGTNTSWAANPLGTVTSVGGTGTVNGLTLTGTVTTSGNLTLGGTLDLTSPPAIGSTTANTGAFTTLSASSTVTLSGGTANGVAYLNGSKVLTTGSALTFDGTSLATTGLVSAAGGAFSGNINPTSGSSVEITYVSGVGYVTSYNRTSSAWTDLYFRAGTNTIWSASGTEAMRLTGTGLGIGTSSPSYKLDVVGALRVTNGAGNEALLVTGNSNTASLQQNGSALYFNSNTNTTGGSFVWRNSSSYTTLATLDSSGNLGLGVTPSAWNATNIKALQISNGGFANNGGSGFITNNAFYTGGGAYTPTYIASNPAQMIAFNRAGGNDIQFLTAASGTAGNAISFTQAMTLDASGNLLVGTTSQVLGTARAVFDTSGLGVVSRTSAGASEAAITAINSATTGNNQFVWFYSDSNVFRGSIEFNRGAGLVSYNTTSDYRAKDIFGPVTDSGALIDSTPVYMGKMKGATQERPMFIAHETPEYAHTGEKDAVDAEGNPVFQQMDASALIPVMWAEIQSLRARLAAAGIA